MNETVTQEQGMESLNVEQAASKFEGILNAQEASQDQPQEQEVTEEVAQAEETQEVSEDQEDNTESEEAPQPETYRIKAEGEEHEVTFDDLVKNYQLEANVRKKMESLAHEKKEVEQLKTNLKSQEVEFVRMQEQRAKMAEGLARIEQALNDQKEDFSHLKETDPTLYARKVAEDLERKQKLDSVKQHQYRLAQEQQAEQMKMLQRKVTEEKKLMAEKIPDIVHPEKGEKIKSEMRAYAKSKGFTDQEFDGFIDSRFAEVLYDATQQNKLSKSKPEIVKKVKKAPKMLKSGVATPSNNESDKIRKLKSHAKKTGKLKDVANVFEAML